MEKVCVACGCIFHTKLSRKASCSDVCKAEHKKDSAKNWVAKNPDKVSGYNKATQKRRIENGKFKAYQMTRRSSKAGYLDRFLERARMINPTTDLTREYLDALFGDSCAITNVPFSFDRKLGRGFQNPYAPSIDRIDSALPYQQGNIQIVLTTVNLAKSEMSMQVFTEVWMKITESWAALVHGKY